MKNTNHPVLSIVIPCHNEESNAVPFYQQLSDTLHEQALAGITYEIVYVNDGSTDKTLDRLHDLAGQHPEVKVIDLSRNFGKEIATSAGIHFARGEAIIMIDGDGQHPVALIPQFIAKWRAGAQVVVGVRASNTKEGFVKRYGSRVFYKLFNRLTGDALAPGTTDFRLIDKVVQAEFIKLTEHNRVTRGLIDWLGFERAYISFHANQRLSGTASYNFPKLVKLALNSSVSLSLRPLYFSAYAGAIILPLSVLLGVFSAIEMLAGDPLHLRVTGSAFLVILILFLVGLLLVSQGIMALYLTHVHTEAQNRPLFVVNYAASKGIQTQ